MSTQVKKAYVELVELLEANANKKVSSILPEIMELVSGKSTSKTFHKVDDEVVAIYCYYHKKWELVSVASYGAKANSATGLNTMCKEGVSCWSKQQRDYKKAKEGILSKVASGELDPSLINDNLEALEVERTKIVPRADDHGFDSLEEALA